MRALVLEDDELVGELLETVVAGIINGVHVSLARSLTEARRRVAENRYDLYLVDWGLPDGSGIELVKQIRAFDSSVPIVIVSGRSDRESVLQAAHYGISGYISKPLDIELLHRRLSELVPTNSAESQSVHDFLLESSNDVVQLPTDLDPGEILDLMERVDELSAAELAEIWRTQIGLTARILDVANSSSFRRTGQPVESLRAAIGTMGVPMALNQALALSLDVANKLSRPELKVLAKTYHDKALSVAWEAQQIAIKLKKTPGLFQSAGLLSRLGEMAVLKVLNQFDAGGGKLEASEIDQCLVRWSAEYGNRLKVHWKFPLSLRELIGAVHFLSADSPREDQIVMRAAALIADGRQEEEESKRLLRRLGLDVSQFTKEGQNDIDG
ncbi:response regulator [Marinobacter sp.]|uniref:response regulator n=1 Tax=Marinobacter sp. TaxID=50741 RepID=UPI00356AFC58